MGTLIIRKIKREELPLIRDFAPPDWNTDLAKMYGQHYDQSYFYPLLATLGDAIAGTGIAVMHQNCAWIGTIIVKEEYRNRGIGNAITHHLMDRVQQQGTSAILLSASHAGLPVYTKIGFAVDSHYVRFEPGEPVSFHVDTVLISPITPDDHAAILALDRAVSGEERQALLLHTFSTGFKYTWGNGIQGYYLPDFGKGLVIADTETAGIELLKYKIDRERSSVWIPESHAVAAGFLRSIGYQPYLTATRMFWHHNVRWNPKKVYARGSGALG